jgi:hypothetical protein
MDFMIHFNSMVLLLFDFHEKCSRNYGLTYNCLNFAAHGKFSTEEPFALDFTVVEANRAFNSQGMLVAVNRTPLVHVTVNKDPKGKAHSIVNGCTKKYPDEQELVPTGVTAVRG